MPTKTESKSVPFLSHLFTTMADIQISARVLKEFLRCVPVRFKPSNQYQYCASKI